MPIRSLHHLTFTVPKGALSEARNFYCGVLGLDEIDRPEHLQGQSGFWLQLSNLQLHVGTEAGVDRHATRAHFGFDVGDLEAWRGRLARHGVSVIETSAIPGVQRFLVDDPFGNRIELVQLAG
jgi:catechol 2,3-dioxygenase-like lactoylglutathione lyase family enzyme